MTSSLDSAALPQGLIWLGTASSLVSAVACLMIAIAATAFLRRRGDLAPVARRIGLLLVGFLLLVALTHLTQATNAPNVAVEGPATRQMTIAPTPTNAVVRRAT